MAYRIADKAADTEISDQDQNGQSKHQPDQDFLPDRESFISWIFDSFRFLIIRFLGLPTFPFFGTAVSFFGIAVVFLLLFPFFGAELLLLVLCTVFFLSAINCCSPLSVFLVISHFSSL